MKIVLTGGGGGHFYPLIAVAEEIHTIAQERSLVKPQLYFFSDKPYDDRALYENDIEFRKTPSGKQRNYRSILNFFDKIKLAVGVLKTIPMLYSVYPDVVFSKGSYASMPTVIAARFLRIPVFVHDSDAVPGRANLWAAKFAARVAISYPQAAEYFPNPEKVALTGNPVRIEVKNPARHGAHEYLELSPDIPTVLVLGGSQGAESINNVVLEALSSLIQKYQIIHQTGEKNFKEISATAEGILAGSGYANRYKPFGFLNALALRMAAGAASIVVSRAGSGSIFELAEWERPAILIPIPQEVSRDQRANAFAYARTGAAIVIEQNNLTPHLLESEITRVLESTEVQQKMTEGAQRFKRPDAARVIAEEIVALALSHEE